MNPWQGSVFHWKMEIFGANARELVITERPVIKVKRLMLMLIAMIMMMMVKLVMIGIERVIVIHLHLRVTYRWTNLVFSCKIYLQFMELHLDPLFTFQ